MAICFCFLSIFPKLFTKMENQSSSSAEQQLHTLLPIAHLFPPNEIITKHYQLDIAPALKLITNNTYVPEAKPDPYRPQIQYAEDFQDTDTLGYSYATAFKNNLLYLKFNNKNFYTLRLKGESYRFMAGMFIPMEHLVLETGKQCKNIYKSLRNFNFVDYSSNIPQSFASNCFSQYPDVQFSSNYEASNLFAAVRTGIRQYNLILQNDINSKGNTQWFNFAVAIPDEGLTYKFNIINFTKSTSLHQKGMRVVYYSHLDFEYHRIGWVRGCQNIEYERSGIGREDLPEQSYYTLKFQFTSRHKNDTVVFAYSYPYNLMDLERFFSRMAYRRISSTMKVEKIKLCETLSGFPVYAYSIIHKKNRPGKGNSSSEMLFRYQRQSKSQTSSNFYGVKVQQRRSVVFMGRQHPGESLASYVIEGIVEFIMESGQHDSMKRNCDFYIIPMVNVDGVFYGNYRTNLSGNDLNRMWRNPKRQYHCEVYNIKKFLMEVNRENPISIIIDVHGHSRSLNSFFYGNSTKKQSYSNYDNPKFFPYFCSKKIKQISYLQSTFSVTDSKKNTARVVLSEMFPRALVYTLETSFYGWKKGNQIIEHNQESYRKVGRDLAMCYLDYLRISGKNTELVEKWQKQIDDIAVLNQDGINRKDQSDSEAENQLINFPELEAVSLERRSEGIQTGRVLKKKPINSRSIKLIKTSRKCLIPMPQSPNLFPMEIVDDKRRSSNRLRKYTAAHKQNGFLSILKIDTNKPQTAEDGRVDDNDKNLALYNVRELLIEKLRRRKVNLQESMTMSSGVHGFLTAMGIGIDKRG